MYNNYAFIDGNNLYHGALNQGIIFDYGRLRLYLRNALSVKKAFLFIGYVPGNTDLYNMLQSAGFTLVFKPTIPYTDGDKTTIKGNVDAELVLHASAIEYSSYDKAVIVSSDGDFACLAQYLEKNDKLLKIITPTKRYSKLLRPYGKYILPLKEIQNNIRPHKKQNK